MHAPCACVSLSRPTSCTVPPQGWRPPPASSVAFPSSRALPQTPACSPLSQLRHWKGEEREQSWGKLCLSCRGQPRDFNYCSLMRRFHHQQHSAEAGRGTGCSACFWLQGEGIENLRELFRGALGRARGQGTRKLRRGRLQAGRSQQRQHRTDGRRFAGGNMPPATSTQTRLRAQEDPNYRGN